MWQMMYSKNSHRNRHRPFFPMGLVSITSIIFSWKKPRGLGLGVQVMVSLGLALKRAWFLISMLAQV